MECVIGTFNIAHGRGLAESNWRGSSIRQRKQRLEAIAAVIQDLDIVVLNEVDFFAPWSWFVNQARCLRKTARFSFMATQHTCRVPFLRYGNVTLSRFPLTDCETIDLTKHSEI